MTVAALRLRDYRFRGALPEPVENKRTLSGQPDNRSMHEETPMAFQARRFGKRMTLPSSVQVRRELRLFSAQEDARHRCAADLGLGETATWEAIIIARRARGDSPEVDHLVGGA
jgi:hypothetical protein